MGAITIINNSSHPIQAFVSKYSNSDGSDKWFTLAPRTRDTWSRKSWELVAFKNPNDSQRAGVYVRVNSTVTFKSFENIAVLDSDGESLISYHTEECLC